MLNSHDRPEYWDMQLNANGTGYYFNDSASFGGGGFRPLTWILAKQTQVLMIYLCSFAPNLVAEIPEGTNCMVSSYEPNYPKEGPYSVFISDGISSGIASITGTFVDTYNSTSVFVRKWTMTR